MSAISDLISLIRTATLGKDVRNALADSLENINGRQNVSESDVDAIKAAYDAATKANTNVELTNARHDSINNVDYETVGARLDGHSSTLGDIPNQLNAGLALKANQSYVDSKFGSMGSTKTFKGSCTDSELSAKTGMAVDDYWYVTDLTTNKCYNGTSWVDIGNSLNVGEASIKRPMLDKDLKDSILEKWIDESVVYAIVDKNQRCALSINIDGKVHINEIDLTEGSLKEITIEGYKNYSTYASGILWAVLDSDDRISDLAIGEDGKILDSIISSWKDRMGLGTVINEADLNAVVTNGTKEISCWGDSLTGGAGGVPSDQLWVGVLRTLSGRTVNNMGVGGETSATISARHGGSHMLVNNITIPATTTAVEIADQQTKPLKDNWGKTVTPLKQQWAGVNPVTISGIEGNLSITDPSLTTSKWYFTRSVAGNEVVINRPTPILTNGMKNYRDDIMIIFIGQNGGWDSESELIQQIRRMIEFNNSVKKDYLVLGLTSGTSSSRSTMENLFSHEFGRRYINLREYLVTYGLDDAGITPTSQDLSDISVGSTPQSLRVDGVHFTATCHNIIGHLVYNRMKELEMI